MVTTAPAGRRPSAVGASRGSSCTSSPSPCPSECRNAAPKPAASRLHTGQRVGLRGHACRRVSPQSRPAGPRAPPRRPRVCRSSGARPTTKVRVEVRAIPIQGRAEVDQEQVSPFDDTVSRPGVRERRARSGGHDGLERVPLTAPVPERGLESRGDRELGLARRDRRRGWRDSASCASEAARRIASTSPSSFDDPETFHQPVGSPGSGGSKLRDPLGRSRTVT